MANLDALYKIANMILEWHWIWVIEVVFFTLCRKWETGKIVFPELKSFIFIKQQGSNCCVWRLDFYIWFFTRWSGRFQWLLIWYNVVLLGKTNLGSLKRNTIFSLYPEISQFLRTGHSSQENQLQSYISSLFSKSLWRQKRD